MYRDDSRDLPRCDAGIAHTTDRWKEYWLFLISGWLFWSSMPISETRSGMIPGESRTRYAASLDLIQEAQKDIDNNVSHTPVRVATWRDDDTALQNSDNKLCGTDGLRVALSLHSA